MRTFGDYTIEQQINRAKEARGLALEFLHTGSIDHTRWSIEVVAGLGRTLTQMATVDEKRPLAEKRAERFAERSVSWANQHLTRLGVK